MILLLYIIISTHNFIHSESLYYQTISKILLNDQSLATTSIQDKNIEMIYKQLYTYKEVLYPHIGLNYINKEKIRRYLFKHNFLVLKILKSIQDIDQIKDITWAFIAFYRHDNLQNKTCSNLLIDAQDMYNIFYHLYNYNQTLQRKLE